MNAQAAGRPIEILLIEDDPDDVYATRLTLEEAAITNPLHVVSDADEALAFLRREGPYANAPRADLILLDLNLPKKNGHEVLAEMQADPELRSIPVVVLTVSTAEEDILQTQKLNCHSYISKPIRLDHFIMLIHSLEGCWVSIMTQSPGD